LPATGLLNCLN